MTSLSSWRPVTDWLKTTGQLVSSCLSLVVKCILRGCSIEDYWPIGFKLFIFSCEVLLEWLQHLCDQFLEMVKIVVLVMTCILQ